MAVKYVKDFEFSEKAGFKKGGSCGYEKGGAAKKGPGVMVLIGLGKPKGPMKKSEGGDVDRRKMAEMAEDAAATTEAERIMRGRGAMTDTESRALANARAASKGKDAASKRKGSPYIPGSNIPVGAIRDQGEQAASEAGSGALTDNRPQYAKGGKAEKKISKVMTEFKEGKLHSGSKEGPKVKSRKQAIAIALSEAGNSKMKKAVGGYAEGGVKVDRDNPLPLPSDEDMQKKAWADRKAQRREAGDKTKKPVFAKGGYAEGGSKKPAPISQEEKEDIVRKDQARGVKVMLGTQAKAKGGMAKHEDVAMDRKLVKQMVKPAALKKAMGGPAAAPQSPLQRMGMQAQAPAMGRAKGVPVAPRAPMIAPPSMGQRGVGVNAKRPGGPDVGKIRAMMAKAATAARPESSPSMMKKGGKAK